MIEESVEIRTTSIFARSRSRQYIDSITMADIALIFPNQLFEQHPVLRDESPKVSIRVLLIEDSLFFGDSRYSMSFHKQKLAYHRATMDAYQQMLVKQGWTVERITYEDPKSVLTQLCSTLAKQGCTRVKTAELNDFMLEKRLTIACRKAGLELVEMDGPGFLNIGSENREYRAARKRWFMADFYQWQRKRLGILMVDDKPAGGQWSFDEQNRKKLPRKQLCSLPDMPLIRTTSALDTVKKNIEQQFPDNPGLLDQWFFPETHESAKVWLDRFLNDRFENFGAYEDAIVANENWLFHSVLSPMLNTGLLTPHYVLQQALQAAEQYHTPLNSVEGFVRQILGWREFMRATYHDLGVPMRTGNNWNHTRPLPQVFYTARTGIDPVDDVIRRVLKTGYCHHIERLMVLGGFMFLCEISPDHIYRWFMELFIDSYDWVMVPNVYAMSQHADGGTITTKPYFSGSNYIIKMSHYRKGDWSTVWDALFWRWIIKNSGQLTGNPRWAMMVKNAQKMDNKKRDEHMRIAESYLCSLDLQTR